MGDKQHDRQLPDHLLHYDHYKPPATKPLEHGKTSVTSAKPAAPKKGDKK